MRILQLNIIILHDERKSSYSFLRSLVKGQDHSFFKDLRGVFCTVGGTLVKKYLNYEKKNFKNDRGCCWDDPGAITIQNIQRTLMFWKNNK
jgi:hypothetical protein